MKKKIKKNTNTEMGIFEGAVSPTLVCQGIQLLINELYSMGYRVYDFDNKERFLQQIMILRDKVYFLAAGEVTADDEKQA